MNRRDFLNTSLGAAAVAAVSERQAAARYNSQAPFDIPAVCQGWFTNHYQTEDVKKVVEALTVKEWGDLPTIPDLMFRKLIVVRPDLKWMRVVSPRMTFDIYESNEKKCDLNTMPPPPSPFWVPSATLPINYYLRNGSAPARLAYALRYTAVELCKHARAWFAENPQFHDFACFVAPTFQLKQEAYLLEMFAYYHVFGSTDEKREEILAAIKKYDNAVKVLCMEKTLLEHQKEVLAQQQQ